MTNLHTKSVHLTLLNLEVLKIEAKFPVEDSLYPDQLQSQHTILSLVQEASGIATCSMTNRYLIEALFGDLFDPKTVINCLKETLESNGCRVSVWNVNDKLTA